MIKDFTKKKSLTKSPPAQDQGKGPKRATQQKKEPPESLDSNGVREIKIFGRNACMAAFMHNRTDIVRAYVTSQSQPYFSDLLRWCAAERKTYHIVSPEDMEKISGTYHHEEVCLLRRSNSLNENDFLTSLSDLKEGVIFYAEGVGNPHNQGAIMRVAAHFGAKAVIFNARPQTYLPGSAYRIAEGGAEHIPALFTADIAILNKAQKCGFTCYATSSHRGVDLFTTTMSSKSIIMLGAERTGLSPQSIKCADSLLTIPGSGLMESLNVSTASAILLAHWYGHHR